ncbi:MAG: PAS domain S-box protein, partial [Gemmatimonadota bacterium]|nr:PAS domain S-box protein [Gemmatimonadota bacterium]
ESRSNTASGNARQLRWTLHTGGESGMVYAVGRDMTAVAQAEDRFRLAIEASPVAIVMTDATGKIVLVNQETQRLFGYGAAELLGQSVEVLVPSELRGVHVAHRDSFTDAPGHRPMGHKRDLVARHRDGTDFPVEIGLSPVKTQQGPGVLATVVDLTARVEAEAAQMKLISQLQTALNEVKTLRGFIPICANCKKVRDDAGFWQSVETYVSARTDADFSHHVCPECGPKLYPEFWDPEPNA